MKELTILDYYEERVILTDSYFENHKYDYYGLPSDVEETYYSDLRELDKKYGFKITDIKEEEYRILVDSVNQQLNDIKCRDDDDNEGW